MPMTRTTQLPPREYETRVKAGDVHLLADVAIPPPRPTGVVVFAHGSGSSRRSPRNVSVARSLQSAGLATVLLDLLTPAEAAHDERTATHRFDIPLLTARVVADNPGDLLKKQMYVRVRISSARAERGLLVPVAAILRDDENLPFVYVQEADGSYARRPVTLGVRTGDRYLIAGGLKAGDKVVTEGGIFVRFIQTQ